MCYLTLLCTIDIASVVETEKHCIVFKYFQDDSHSSLVLFRTLQGEYVYAQYLSEVNCFSNRRLLSRFRNGCHGLRVDTGRWENNVHLDRLCLVCRLTQHVEDEHHFLLIALLTALCELVMPACFSKLAQFQSCFTRCEAKRSSICI